MADSIGISLPDTSAIVTGLVLEGRLAPNAVRTEILFPPYDNLVKLFKQGLTPEEIIERGGLTAYQSALDAVHTLNGTASADWVSILETKSMQYDVGARMEKLGRRLQEGKDVDPVAIRDIANRFGKGKSSTIPLSKIENVEVPRIKSGHPAIDEHFHGWPEAGLIVLAGQSGTGKTTMVRDLSKCFAREHPDKVVLFYSLEMYQEELAGRYREATNEEHPEYENRILINCDHLNINQIFTDAARFDNVGIVFIDFIDLLVFGEASESKYAEVYLAAHYGAKDLHCPVVLLAQFTKEYEKTGGPPLSHHIRWTGMSRILASMQLMLYRPEKDPCAENFTELPIYAGIGYLICRKSRAGIKGHPEDDEGAIQLKFHGVKGWSTNGPWFSLSKLRR